MSAVPLAVLLAVLLPPSLLPAKPVLLPAKPVLLLHTKPPLPPSLLPKPLLPIRPLPPTGPLPPPSLLPKLPLLPKPLPEPLNKYI
jgi:hypothetical protein